MKSILHLKEDTEYQIPLREDVYEKHAQDELEKWKKKHPDATEQEVLDKEKELNYQIRKAAGQPEEEIERREKARAIRHSMKKDNKEIGRAKAGVASATQAHKDATAKVSQAVQKKKETEADVEYTKDNADEIADWSQKKDAEAQQNLETSKEDAKQAKAAVSQSQNELHDAQKSKNDKINQLKADSAAAKETKKKADEISQEEVDQAEQDATEGLEEDPEETQQPTEETAPEASNEAPASETPETLDDTLKKLRELSTVEGEITPQVFIDHYKSILNLIEHAMQLRVKEGSSATEQKAEPEPAAETTNETHEDTSDK